MKRYYRSKVSVNKLSGLVLQKWPRDVLDEGFSPYPKRLVRCASRIFTGPSGMHQLSVVMAIIDIRGASPQGDWVTLDFLAYLADMSATEFKRQIESLKEMKLLTWKEQGNRVWFDLDHLNARIMLETHTDSQPETPTGSSTP